MLKASFTRREELCAFTVKGHALYAPKGEDIVCASVSSAVQLAVNGITEITKAKAETLAGEDSISVTLLEPNAQAVAFLEALLLHLQLLSEDYPNYIQVSIMEV